MWTCDKCGRSFKTTGQHHFCGKIETIDAYIEEQDEAVRPILHKLREVIRKAAPDCTEKISWLMPTFWQGENLIHFAAFKHHIGVYPGDMTDSPYTERLRGYSTDKGTVRFPLDKPIDFELISEVTKWRVACAEAKHSINKRVYEFDGVIVVTPEQDGAYVIFPYDVRKEFGGKGRVKVSATFDGVPYDGSVVNMGVKNEDGSVCYIIGIRKDIRAKIGKQSGDTVHVTIRERK